jgi:hypothetical protein
MHRLASPCLSGLIQELKNRLLDFSLNMMWASSLKFVDNFLSWIKFCMNTCKCSCSHLGCISLHTCPRHRYCHVYAWLIRRDFRLADSIYFILYIHTVRDYKQYSSIAILHTLQFTVAHALGSSVFTSRILATDLSQSHWHFKSPMKSSGHPLISFLPFLVNHLRLPPPKLDPIPILAAWNPRYIASGRTPQKIPPYILERVYSSVA